MDVRGKRLRKQDLNIKSEFVILHDGWEMDNRGWITTDGKVYTTNHGGDHVYEMSLGEIDGKIAEADYSLQGLKKARNVLAAE